MSHTPGPFYLDRSHDITIHSVTLRSQIWSSTARCRIAFVELQTVGEDQEEANAVLFAASDEMLAALKCADEALENAYGAIGPKTPDSAVLRDMQAVKDAIAKAEGRA